LPSIIAEANRLYLLAKKIPDSLSGGIGKGVITSLANENIYLLKFFIALLFIDYVGHNTAVRTSTCVSITKAELKKLLTNLNSAKFTSGVSFCGCSDFCHKLNIAFPCSAAFKSSIFFSTSLILSRFYLYSPNQTSWATRPPLCRRPSSKAHSHELGKFQDVAVHLSFCEYDIVFLEAAFANNLA